MFDKITIFIEKQISEPLYKVKGMKRIAIIILALIAQQSMAQIADDALMLSRYTYDGTARTTAMGGAFTALGGDLTSASLNPAGLGLYRSNDFSFSISGNMNRTDGMYRGNSNNTHHYRTIMPSFGVALSAPNIWNMDNNEGPKSYTFAIGYNQIHTFNRSFGLVGNNNNTSFLDMVLDDVNYYGIFVDTDVVYELNSNYTHDYLEQGYGATQEAYLTETGGIGEYYISGGANFNDKVYVGGTLGIQSVYYSRTFNYTETPTNDIALNYFDYQENITTRGVGLNAKIGFIYVPVYWSKIGVSLHTPTSFQLTDDWSEDLSASIDYNDGPATNNWSEEYYVPEYEILSPMRLQAGVSFLVMRTALVSLDYEFVDYSTAQISSEEATFNDANNDISNFYEPTHSFRLGMEYKWNMMAFRAGGFYYDSPHQSGYPNVNNNRLGYTAGIGIRSGSFYFDMAYSQMNEDFKYSPYYYEQGEVDSRSTRILGTIGFRF